MNFINIFLGIALMILGAWLTVYSVNQFQKRAYDSSGWRIRFLIIGIALVVYGIVEIYRQI